MILNITGVGRWIDASEAGTVINSVFDFLGQAVSVLILLALGYGFVFSKNNISDIVKTVILRAAIYFITGLILAAVSVRFFPNDPLYKYAAILIAFMPPSFAFPSLIKDSGEFVGNTIAVYTVFSLILYLAFSAFVL